MEINKQEVLSQNVDYFNFDMARFPYLKNVQEHYRLLTYLSKKYDNITMLDAGTSFGHSCLALAQNPNNKIITYDIQDKNFEFFKTYTNIEFKKLDINKETPEIIKSAKIILLDVDPHDGLQEQVFTDYLTAIDYKGYVICDDIFLNEPMKKWWDGITVEKYDVTSIGHMSGTGIINYNKDGNFKLND
jgi:predicted O-methyltransferase YrrM